MKSPEIPLEDALNRASRKDHVADVFSKLKKDCIDDLKTIVSHAETFKGVLGVTLTSIVYKSIHPSQDILTTSEPNCNDQESVAAALSKYRRLHSCQIIVNGVLPSLKYYLRLVSNPAMFIETYTDLLHHEYQRGSGIKKQHLQIWQNIRKEFPRLIVS